MHTRDFESRDAERASAILIAAFRSFLGDWVDGGASLHFHPAELLKTARVEDAFGISRIFVAEEGDRLLGVVRVTARTNGLGMFDYVGVAPDAPPGVGSLLMARAEAFWMEHDQRKIDTCVSAHNKRAIRYYLKHDFIPEGYRRDHFHDGVDEIILGRFLKKGGAR
jgi:ribosomal protein S18 acetylase RimI-like enzyme